MSEDRAKRFMDGAGLFLWALNEAVVKHAQLPQPRPDFLTWLAAENLAQARRDLLGDLEDETHAQGPTDHEKPKKREREDETGDG